MSAWPSTIARLTRRIVAIRLDLFGVLAARIAATRVARIAAARVARIAATRVRCRSIASIGSVSVASRELARSPDTGVMRRTAVPT